MDAILINWRSALLFALFLPLLVTALMLALRGTERAASLALAGLLAAWAIHSIPFVIGFSGAYRAWPWLTFAPVNTLLWLGPLLYIHTRALVRPMTPRATALWLLPGAVQTTYYTICFLGFPTVEAKWAYNDAFHAPFVIPVETAAGLLLTGYATFSVWRESLHYRRWLDANHSAATEFDPVWLRRLLLVSVLMCAIWFGFAALDSFVMDLRYLEAFWLYLAIGSLLLWLGLDALSRAAVRFPKRGTVQAPALAPTGSLPSAEQLRTRIEAERWYTDPDLTLTRLARLLGTNETYLSRAINSGSGMNFNRFINDIRIAHVCARLGEGETSDTLLDIALAAGFSSKATFNRVFRETTGTTPSKWRRQSMSPSETSQIA